MNQFDLNKCHARLNKEPTKQCRNNKRIGDLCGVHANVHDVLLITEPLNNNDIDNNITGTIVNDLSNLNLNPKRLKRDYSSFNKHVKSIVKIQSLIRGFLVRNYIKTRGIPVYCKHLNTNDTDFLSFEELTDISNKNFFSYKDADNRWWGFDIATLKELLKNSTINPYNTCEIGDDIINKFNNLLKKIENYRSIEIKNEVIDDPEIRLQQRCISVFQKMDNLKQYTKCEWFLSLNLQLLRSLYKYMEDMWNYRIGLSSQSKLRYVTNGKVFTETMVSIWRITDKYKLANILLNDFDRMVSEGITESDKSTACLWILSGLTLVNTDARNAMPWLYESAVGN